LALLEGALKIGFGGAIYFGGAPRIWGIFGKGEKTLGLWEGFLELEVGCLPGKNCVGPLRGEKAPPGVVGRR